MGRTLKTILVLGVASSAVIAAGLIMRARETPPPTVASAPPPAVPLPPVAAPEPPAAPPSDTAAETPAPSDALPPLPVQQIEPRVAHMVDDDVPLPIPHVTVEDRSGRVLSRPAPAHIAMAPPAPRASTPLSSLAPIAPTAGAQRTPHPAPAPRPPQIAALQPIPATLSGPAHATGTISLGLDGHAVRLFGVLPPASTDRCTLGRGSLQPCYEVTQEVLASRVARSPSVTCRVPPGLSESNPSRICLDAEGGDIAGYLVAEGLALADRRTTGDYIGAEGIAQSYGKGLWHYR